ncbi:putative MFS multidrug transporter [Thozetella sp. PMI_491]|nr:putative MFS multidrug transporter [Thozetella sp. PMI_491]
MPRHSDSVLSRMRLRNPQRPFTHPLGQEKTGIDAIVDFDGSDDPYHPMNWPARKKIATVLLYGLTATGASFNSAVFSSASAQVASEFNVSTIVTSLATSLILLGFALGPLVWGPLSELYGRKWVVLLPYFVSAGLAFGCGASADIQTILAMRFFQGVFGSSVITTTSGVLSDIYAPKERGTALIIYSMSVVGGPLLAPIVGSAITTSYLGWRWTMYIVGILQLFTAMLATLMLDESYAPILLLQKARQLRFETGNWALHAKHEEWKFSLLELGRKYLVRPFLLLADPICFLMSFYASFVYGLLFGSLSAIPIVFEGKRGWSPVVGSLPFIALLLGCVLGLAGNTVNSRMYSRAVDSNGGRSVPEARLYPMMVGSFSLAIGLFIFGWTGGLDIIWVVPCIGILLIGGGFYPIFQASLNYAPVAAVTFMRSIFGAAFPLFMANKLGIAWGLSVLGFIGVLMLPVPFLFFFFGKQIRARGNFSKANL